MITERNKHKISLLKLISNYTQLDISFWSTHTMHLVLCSFSYFFSTPKLIIQAHWTCPSRCALDFSQYKLLAAFIILKFQRSVATYVSNLLSFILTVIYIIRNKDNYLDNYVCFRFNHSRNITHCNFKKIGEIKLITHSFCNIRYLIFYLTRF